MPMGQNWNIQKKPSKEGTILGALPGGFLKPVGTKPKFSGKEEKGCRPGDEEGGVGEGKKVNARPHQGGEKVI